MQSPKTTKFEVYKSRDMNRVLQFLSQRHPTHTFRVSANYEYIIMNHRKIVFVDYERFFDVVHIKAHHIHSTEKVMDCRMQILLYTESKLGLKHEYP